MKRHALWVKKYVKKFYASQFDQDVLNLTNRVVTLSQDFHQARKAMAEKPEAPENLVLIYVECKFSSLHVLFAIKNSLERRFREKMYNDVQLLMKVNYSRTDALKKFYELNSLTDEDYDFQSAYRLMQKMEKNDPQALKPLSKSCEKSNTL